jgi:aspartate racemase
MNSSIKHIGIVACSAEGAALAYRTICSEAAERMGKHDHPEISMHTYPLARYMTFIESGNWEGVAELMLLSAGKLARSGAQFAICPDNTIHQSFDIVIKRSPIPWLHIADAVVECAKRNGFSQLAILGTKYLMEGPVYADVCHKNGLSFEIPEIDDRIRINEIIFKELVYGILHDRSRLYFNEVMKKLKCRGCDAAVLGCTEIPLLVNPAETPLPTLDSTRLLARAALKKAMDGR